MFTYIYFHIYKYLQRIRTKRLRERSVLIVFFFSVLFARFSFFPSSSSSLSLLMFIVFAVVFFLGECVFGVFGLPLVCCSFRIYRPIVQISSFRRFSIRGYTVVVAISLLSNDRHRAFAIVMCAWMRYTSLSARTHININVNSCKRKGTHSE